MRPSSITQKQWIKYNWYFVLEHFLGAKNVERYLQEKRNALYNEVLQNKGFTDRTKDVSVSDIEYDSFKPFENNKSALLNSTYVFRGIAKDWQCVKKWSKDFFLEHYGNTKIALIDNPGLVDKKQENIYTQTNIGAYLKAVKKDKNKYLRFSRILDHNPELLQDLDLEWLRQFKWGWSFGEQSFMFMGEGGTITPMHAGLTHTLFIQVTGRKKWIICDPNERFFLNPVAERLLYFYTDADPKNQNDPKFPLLSYAKKYELVLEQGDVLWFPSLTWHHIENLSSNIGVAFKFTNLPHSFAISKVLTTLFLLATKPTILQSFAYNKSNKQDFVFNAGSAKLH